MRARRIRYLVKKDVTEIVRQKELLFLILVVPILEIIVLGYVIAMNIRNIPVAVIDTSGSPAVCRLIGQIAVSPLLRLEGFSRPPEEALTLLKKGRVRGVVTFRPAPANPALPMELPDIQILVDGSDAVAAQFLVGALSGIVRDFAAGEIRSAEDSPRALPAAPRMLWPPSLAAKIVVRFNPDLRAIDSQGPGLVGLLLTFVTFILAGLALVREKEQQTWDTLLVSRLRPIEIFMGKGLPAAGAGVVHLLFGIPILMFWFKVPFRGNAGLLFLASVIYLAAIVSLALAFSALSGSQQQAMFLVWYTIMTIVILSGFFTPIESMPSEAFLSRAVAAVNPFRYLMRVVRDIMLKGAGVGAVLNDLLVLTGLAAVFAAGSFLLFRRTLKR